MKIKQKDLDAIIRCQEELQTIIEGYPIEWDSDSDPPPPCDWLDSLESISGDIGALVSEISYYNNIEEELVNSIS